MSDSRRHLATEADGDLCDAQFIAIVDHYGGDLKVNELPVPHRTVLLVWHAMGIIDNGGFQYLFEGDFSGDPGFTLTADAFEEIGCVSAAEAVRGAIALFPNGKVVADIDERLRLFQSTPESQRTNLTKKFWKASDVGMGEICLKLVTYIRSHQAEFMNVRPHL
jgi:hypothetical protein